ncbi:MAG: DUF2804 domain-containing protein, partial [Deltaproteobacteria bacterium]
TLDAVDYGPLEASLWQRALRTKRWLYLGIATDDLYVAVAVVHLGYASSVFAYVFDRRVGRNVASVSMVAPALAARVASGPGGGSLASFRTPGARVSVGRDAADVSEIVLDARFRGLEIRARLDTSSAPPGVVAIAPVPGGLVNTTQKRALLPVTGEVVVHGRRHALTGGIGGYDSTHGLLARHTMWRWAFLLGRARDGAPVAMNLVEGFVGERECVVWLGHDIHGVGEGRVALDRATPLAPWGVTTADGAVDLRFTPADLHAEKRNAGLLVADFVQAVGSYTGTIRLPGRAPVEIVDVLGVAEDHRVRW